MSFSLTKVFQWISRLKEIPRCTKYMVEFLDYIANSMLLVDRGKRDKSRQVANKQLAFFNKCTTDEKYAASSATPSEEISPEQRQTREGGSEQEEVGTQRRQQSVTSRFFSGLCCCK